jgi:hypothetical protein
MRILEIEVEHPLDRALLLCSIPAEWPEEHNVIDDNLAVAGEAHWAVFAADGSPTWKHWLPYTAHVAYGGSSRHVCGFYRFSRGRDGLNVGVVGLTEEAVALQQHPGFAEMLVSSHETLSWAGDS